MRTESGGAHTLRCRSRDFSPYTYLKDPPTLRKDESLEPLQLKEKLK